MAIIPSDIFLERIQWLAAAHGWDSERLREKVGLPSREFDAVMEEREVTDRHVLRFAAAFDVSEQLIVESLTPVQAETQRRLIDYLRRVGELHMFPHYWHRIRVPAYRSENPWNDEMFRSLLHDEGLTDFGFSDQLDE